jgi:hypothetical protein
MNCTCIKDTEERLKTRVLEADFASSRPRNSELSGIRCSNLLLALKSGEWMLMIPFNAEWTVKGKVKNAPVNIAADYCPFCGISLK